MFSLSVELKLHSTGLLTDTKCLHLCECPDWNLGLVHRYSVVLLLQLPPGVATGAQTLGKSRLESINCQEKIRSN